MWGSDSDVFDRGHEWPMRAIVGLQYTLPPVCPEFSLDSLTRDLLRPYPYPCLHH